MAEREALLDVASDLGLSIPEKDIPEHLDTAADLETTAETLYRDPPQMESRGQMADDEHNALLEVYDEPRIRATGPLDDVTVAVKDLIAVEGLRMTCGVPDFEYVPSFDATVVDRLLSAGAGILGKTNLDTLGFGPTGEFSHFGKVTNPLAPDRVPGGSSSGSAVAIVDGTVDAALGTDTGGSVRVPAACTGVVGMKPTTNAVSRHGLAELAPSLDTIGPMARDVETTAAVLEAMAGHDPRDTSTSHVDLGSLTDLDGGADLTFGVLEPFTRAADDAVEGVVRETADALAEAGASVKSVPFDLGQIQTAYLMVTPVEFAWLVRQGGVPRGRGTWYDEEWRQAFQRLSREHVGGDHVAWRILPGALLDARSDGRAYAAAWEEITDFRTRLQALFEDVDLLLTPTMRVLPPEYDSVEGTESVLDVIGNTGPFNLTGSPAIALDAGERQGLPVSVQLVGDHFDDATVLRGARLVEQVR